MVDCQSCLNACGSIYANCRCDSQCLQMFDCCADYMESCTLPFITSVSPVSVPVSGGSITLTGGNFGATNSLNVSYSGQYVSLYGNITNIAALKCTITTISSGSVVCTVPAGSGGPSSFSLQYKVCVVNYLFMNGLCRFSLINPLLNFGYTAPAITAAITPSTCITLPISTTLLTVTGSNFAIGAYVVALGNRCVSIFVSSTQLKFIPPPGSGQNIQVFVVVPPPISLNTTLPASFPSSNIGLYSYIDPVISSVLVKSGTAYTQGGAVMSIVGTNFGGVTGSQSVYFGGLNCNITTSSSIAITCILPPGSGRVAVTLVTSGGITSNSFPFTYVAPIISSIIGTNFAPTSGQNADGSGYLITLVGNSFGTSLAPTVVSVGGSACPINSQTNTNIECFVPPGQSSGISVSISVNLLNSNILTTFSYAKPVVISIFPVASAETIGGSLITIYGANFGLSATATILGNDCPVIWQNHTSLICVVPPGVSITTATVAVLVTAGKLVSTSVSLSVYGAPFISSIFPETFDSAGVDTLTVYGNNFGSSGSIKIGAISGVPIIWNHTQIQLNISPGTGLNYSVIATVATKVSNPVFVSYNPPIITSVSPLSSPTEGGVSITINGNNFGIVKTAVSIIIQPLTVCTVTSVTHTQVVCTVGVGSGSNLTILVTVSSQFFLTAGIFNFSAPRLITITPSRGGTAGGNVITITGSSFDKIAGFVTIGGLPCSITSFASTRILCKPSANQGVDLPVVVIASTGLQSMNILFYSYIAPTITRVSPTPISTGPLATRITITGTNFGISGQLVFISGIPCPLDTSINSTSTLLYCRAPPGTGIRLLILVYVAEQESTGAVTLSYSPPVLSSITPNTNLPTRGNVSITLTGTNFGANVSVAEVLVGSVQCVITSISYTSCVCVLQAGQGKSVLTKIIVDSQISGTVAIAFGIPIILTISPSSASTSGGTHMTITGTNFGMDIGSMNVAFGSLSCVLLFVNHTAIVCILPQGEGSSINVIVTVSAQVSAPKVFSYAAPIINSITPFYLSSLGGDVITIFGTSFGITSIVNVGGVSCPITSRSHTVLTCVLPSGQGTKVPVIVSVAVLLSSPFLYNYSAPIIENVYPNPSMGPTIGGTLLNITGTNFGSVGYVNVGSGICSPIIIWNNLNIVCASPPGQGLNQVISVTAYFQTSADVNFYFDYNAPNITYISPLRGSTGGNFPITILGNNFGVSGGFVTIGNRSCIVSSSADYSHNKIVCFVPAGSGVSNQINLFISNQFATSGAIIFAYDAPSISKIFPSEGPIAGGNIITLNGDSFDSYGIVTLNGINCAIVTWTHTEILFLASPGSGPNRAVLVTTIGNQSTSSPISYSYSPPVITSILPLAPTEGKTLVTIFGSNIAENAIVTIGVCIAPPGKGSLLSVVVQCGSQVSNQILFSYSAPTLISIAPSSAPSSGGSLVTLTGSSFGSDPNGSTVFFGDTVCSIIFWNHTAIVFVLPPGEGTGISVRITVLSQSSNSVVFFYSSPVLFNLSPRFGPTGPINDLAVLTLVGTSFGVSKPTVFLGSSLLNVLSWNHTVIFCNSVIGIGTNLPITVKTVATSISNALLFSYFPPNITNLYPSSVPSEGNVVISIIGSSFGSGNPDITVKVWIDNQPVTVISQLDNLITFMAPVGSGRQKVVTLNVGLDDSTSQSTISIVPFNYLPPSIYSVTPVSANTNGFTGIIRETISLTGSSFSATAAGSIYIGEKLCSTVPGSFAENSASCYVPVGYGVQLNISIVTFDGQVGYASQLFSYNPPIITSIFPDSGVTESNSTILTIYGTSFSLIGEVYVGNSRCLPTRSGISHNYIECFVPSGRGPSNSVVVKVDGRFSNSFNFAYFAPKIAFITPQNGIASGNIPLTIYGSNFGNTIDSNLEVRVGDSSCPVIIVNSSVLVCTLPPASGEFFQNILLKVLVSTQFSDAYFYSYNGPIITQLLKGSSECLQSGNALINCPFSISASITIVGLNFGDATAIPVVAVGNKLCNSVAHVSGFSFTHLTCDVPPGTGSELEVTVTIAGLSGVARLFSYSTPSITPGTLKLAGSAFSSSSLFINTSLSVMITFNGSSLVGSGGTFVTFGTHSNPTIYTCENSVVQDTFIFCIIPASAVGLGLVFRVRVLDTIVGSLFSNISSDTISFQTALIVPNTISRVESPLPGQSSIQGIYSTGEIISFDVLHAGRDSTKILSITYGTYSQPDKYTCNNIQISSYSEVTDTAKIQCFTSSGSGGPFMFRVFVLNYWTAVGTDEYSYPITPELFRVSGCVDDGNITSSCSTLGGTVLTIHGAHFSNSDITVKIGVSNCDQILYIDSQTLQCILPAGTGFNKQVYIIVGFLFSPSSHLLSYKAATLSSITGCPDAGSSACPREGGTMITIVGSEFGVSGAIVLIAGNPCYNITHDSLTPASKLTCILSSVIFQVSPVILIQESSQISINQLYLTYASCLPGTVAQLNDHVCLHCPVGSYSDIIGLYDCKVCPSGTFNNVNSSSFCSSCEFGHISVATATKGASSCTACSAGRFSSLPPLSECLPCTPGKYNNRVGSSACIACFAGNYSLLEASTSCSLCPRGTFSPITTVGGVSLCTGCNAGSFSSIEGATSCINCPAGYKQPSSSMSSCLVCPVGSAVSQTGQISCNVCPSGYFSNSTGLPFCSLCKPGSYSNTNDFPNGATSCFSCKAGEYVDILAAPICLKCDIGQYSNFSGSSVCSLCDAGFTNDVTGKTVCSACEKGYFASSLGTVVCGVCNQGYFAPFRGSTFCSSCPMGSYHSCELCPAGTSSFKGTECVPCGSGKFSNESGSPCVSCLAGSYSLTSSIGPTVCLLCGPGTFQDGINSATCNPCSLGSVQRLYGATSCTLCASGTVGLSPISCVNCSAGSYSSSQGLVVCSQCPRGYFQKDEGKSFCNECLAGSFQSSVGETFCLFCPVGRFSSAVGQGDCVDAPVGSFANVSAAISTLDCFPGSFTSSVSMSYCNQCVPGYFANNYDSGQCTACAQGFYSADYGSTICLRCPAGKYADLLALTYCKSCPVGSFFSGSDGGAVTCHSCSSGSYSNITASTSCTLCDIGHFQPNSGSSFCSLCYAGKYAYERGSGQECTSCPSGTFSDFFGATVCTLCSIGSYNLNIGSSFCSNCPAGYFAANFGAVKCTACEAGRYRFNITDMDSGCLVCSPGFFQNNVGETACIACPRGKFQSDYNQLKCEDCPSGRYNELTGVSSCEPCSAGSFSVINEFGTSACTLCGVGFYSGSGAAECTSCSFGSYSNSTGSTTCILCGPGTYQNNPTSTSCTDCPIGYMTAVFGDIGCVPCAAGRYSNQIASVDCLPCLQGYYQILSAQSTCVACPAGYFTSAIAQVACQACDIGQYSNVTSSVNCLSCSRGSYGNEIGHSICLMCGQGKFSAQVGQSGCNDCSPGFFNSIIGSSTCQPCTSGYFTSEQTGSQRFSCSACNPGFLLLNDGLYLGKYNPSLAQHSCLHCPAGSFSRDSGATVCLQCPENSFQPSIGQTSCVACPFGTFVNGLGNSLCVDCPAGKFSENGVCKNCVSGTFSSSPHASACGQCGGGFEAPFNASLACFTCSPGFFSLRGENCRSCSRGTYSLIGFSSCTLCPLGTIQPLSSQAFCQNCAGGQYNNNTGSTICSICPAGYYSQLVTSQGANFGPTACISCLPGRFNNVDGQDECALCSAGLFSSQNGSTVCESCLPGFFSDSLGQSTCKSCAVGKFSNTFGARNCLECSLGRYSAQTGSTICSSCSSGTAQNTPSSSACKSCIAGFFMPLGDQPNCFACAAGSFNNETGLTFCYQCPAGYISSDSGMRTCQACSAGKYIGTSGQIRCLNCPLGSFMSSVGATSCELCPPGEFMDLSGSYVCNKCPIGKYQPNIGSIECHECRVGEFSNITGLSVCFDCFPGTHNTETGRTLCRKCEIGTFSAISKQIQCSKCAPGLYSSVEGLTACIGCSAGYYGSSVGQSSCLPCIKGTYSITTGQTSCPDCNPGSFSNGTSSSVCLSCFRGTFMNSYRASVCIACPIGSDTSAVGSIECEQCGPGKYSDVEGTSSCLLCPSGSRNIYFNQTTCFDCPSGRFSGEGQKSCDPCMPGTFNSFVRQSACAKCLPGFFQSNQAALSCEPCSAGSFSSQFGSISCVPCSLGTYVAGVGVSACNACPVGTFGNRTQAESCLPCPLGTFSNVNGSTICPPCQPGTKSSPTSGSSTCLLCEAGYYQDLIGQFECKSCPVTSFAPTSGLHSCISCPSGSFSNKTSLSACSNCPLGHFQSNRGTTSCIACSPGFFSSSLGSVFCTGCNIGYFQSDAGQSFCNSCPQGKYQNSPASTACFECDVGHFGPIVRMSSCRPCPAGSFSNVTGLSICSFCSQGMYQDLINQTTCQSCGNGTYASLMGQGSCSPCVAGTYNDVWGVSSCKLCSPGKYASVTSSSFCTDCEIAYATSASGSSVCPPCPPGSYGLNYTAQSSCFLCPISYYSAKSASINCLLCPSGTEAQVEGSTQCTLCSPGKYWNLINQTAQCVNCPAGYFNPSVGSTLCLACSPGYSTNGAFGSSFCRPCTDNTVALNNATSSCSGCDPLSIPNPTRTNCICIEGYYSDISKKSGSICVSCPSGSDCSQPGTDLKSLGATAGYWRPDDSSLLFSKCIISSACLGGLYRTGRVNSFSGSFLSLVDSDGDSITINSTAPIAALSKTTCRIHHTGPLCAVCETGNQRDSSGICYPCPSFSQSIIYFCVICAFIFIALVIQIAALLRISSELIRQEKVSGDTEVVDQFTRTVKVMSHDERVSHKVMSELLKKIQAREASKRLAALMDSKIEGLDEVLDKSLVQQFSSLPLFRSGTFHDFTHSRLKLKEMSTRNEKLVDIDNQNRLTDDVSNQRHHIVKSESNDFTWKIKIMLGFLQIITNIAISIEIPWPSTFISLIRVLSVVNFDFISISSADCIAKVSFYFRYMVSLFAPIGIYLGVFLLYLVPKFLCSRGAEMNFRVKQRAEAKLGRCLSSIEEEEYAEIDLKASRERTVIRYYRILEFFLFLIYPTVSSNVLRLFVCKNVNGLEGLYLFADFSESCYTTTWYLAAFVSIPFVILYPLGIPLFFFYRLFTNRNKLESPYVQAENGFLYDGYYHDVWYFEMVDMLHKLILTSALAFLPLSYQIPFALIVVILMSVILLITRPYKSNTDDRLHLLVQVELYLFLLCGYAYQNQYLNQNNTTTATASQQLFDYLITILLVLAVSALFAFFVYEAIIFLREYFKSWCKNDALLLESELEPEYFPREYEGINMAQEAYLRKLKHTDTEENWIFTPNSAYVGYDRAIKRIYIEGDDDQLLNLPSTNPLKKSRKSTRKAFITLSNSDIQDSVKIVEESESSSDEDKESDKQPIVEPIIDSSLTMHAEVSLANSQVHEIKDPKDRSLMLSEYSPPSLSGKNTPQPHVEREHRKDELSICLIPPDKVFDFSLQRNSYSDVLNQQLLSVKNSSIDLPTPESSQNFPIESPTVSDSKASGRNSKNRKPKLRF